jgi:hypothetical protein
MIRRRFEAFSINHMINEYEKLLLKQLVERPWRFLYGISSLRRISELQKAGYIKQTLIDIPYCHEGDDTPYPAYELTDLGKFYVL